MNAIHQEFDSICSFRIAGDWVTYIAVLEQGDIAFVPESLNLHRRHSFSVTLGGDIRPHMLEILRVQRMVAHRYGLQDEVAVKVAHYDEYLRGHFGFDHCTFSGLMANVAPPTEGVWDHVLGRCAE